MGVNVYNVASNAFSSFANDVQSNLTSGKIAIENILGTLKTGLSNIFDGGFAGLDEKNYNILQSAIEKYVSDAQNIVAEFNPDNNGADIAYKGDVKVAVDDFLAAIKLILQAYVSTMKIEIAESKTAFEEWHRQTRDDVAKKVTQNASEIEKNAEKIKLD